MQKTKNSGTISLIRWESRCILISRDLPFWAARKKHKNPMLRAADIELKNLFVEVKDYQLEPEPTKNLIDFCMNHQLSMTNLLLLGIHVSFEGE